jgi:hypothetical protein
MNNSTIFEVNQTATDFFLLYHIPAHLLIAVFLCGPPLVLHAIFVTALLASRSVKPMIKVILTNISLASAAYVVALLIWILSFITRVLQPGLQNTECYVTLWLQICTNTTIFLTLLPYGITVFVATRCGLKRVPIPFIIITAVGPWVLGACNTIAIFSPVNELNATEVLGACDYRANIIVSSIKLSFSLVVIGLGVCLTTIILVVISYCYLKKNAINEVSLLQKAAHRLAVFLILSVFINIGTNMIIPAVYVIFMPRGFVAYYASIIIPSIATWPSAISLIVVCSTVRDTLRNGTRRLKQCCCRCKDPRPQQTSNPHEINSEYLSTEDKCTTEER